MSIQPGPESLLAGQIADIVQRNSHELTATQLLTTRQELVEQAQRHAAEIARIKTHLTESERIGLHVQRAEASGRKTIRIADIITRPEEN